MDMNLSKLWETVEDGGAWLAAALGVTKSQAQFNDWTTKQLYTIKITPYSSLPQSEKPSLFFLLL